MFITSPKVVVSFALFYFIAYSKLQEQAQAQGWNKANKLEGRNTSQGLIGVCLSSDETAAAIVELNSETDFVSRNKQFHNLLNTVISVILEKSSKGFSANNECLK